MGRPQPTIIFDNVTEDYECTQICDGDGVFAVFYRNRPIMIRTKTNIEIEYPGWKYAKTCFVSPGHAFGLARRLNKKFDTTEFTVVKMTAGKAIRDPLFPGSN